MELKQNIGAIMQCNHSLIILSLILIGFAQTSFCEHSHSSSSNTDPQGHSDPSKQLAKQCNVNPDCGSNAVCHVGICNCVADYEPDSSAHNCVKTLSSSPNNGGLQVYAEVTLIISCLTASVTSVWNW